MHSLEPRIRALAELTIGELKQAWTEAWTAPPPKGARRRLMMLGIAWRWQTEVHGGFGKPLERRLATLEAAFRQGGALSREGPGASVDRIFDGRQAVRLEGLLDGFPVEWEGQVQALKGSAAAAVQYITALSVT